MMNILKILLAIVVISMLFGYMYSFLYKLGMLVLIIVAIIYLYNKVVGR